MPYNVTPNKGVGFLQFGIFDNAKLKNTYDDVPEIPGGGNYLLLVAYDTLYDEKTWCILAIPIDNTPMYIYNYIAKSWKRVSTVS